MAISLDDLIPLLNYVKRYDGYVAAICPFHDDNSPSMLVFEKEPGRKHGWFQCLSCEARGTHEYLYSVLEGAPVRVLPREKTAWGLPPLPRDQEGWETLAYTAHEKILDRPHLRWYWKMRGVDDMVEPCNLGWYSGWYTVPVLDQDGGFLRLIMRAGAHIQKRTNLRYYTSPGSPVMFVPNWRRYDTASTIFVVFGTIDSIGLGGLGLAVATSTAGKAQFKAEWLRERRVNIRVIPDRGEEATGGELVRRLGARAKLVQLHYPGTYNDPADYIAGGDGRLLQKELARWA